MRIVFFGTPRFAARILSYLLEHGVEIIAVVTKPDRPRGRSLQFTPTAVKEALLLKNSSLPIFQPVKASTSEFYQTLKELEPDLFVVVAYGEIIKQNLLDLPKLGCINAHASILPKYRGAAPMQRCLMDGVKETGVSIMEMVLQMDAGDIIEIAKIPVPEEMTCGELEEKLCDISCETLLNVLKNYQEKKLKKTPQNHTEASFAPKITVEDEEIFWTKSSTDLHNQIRALSPFPGAWCWVYVGDEKKRLKIKRSRSVKNKGSPGEIVSKNKDELIVGCGEGSLSILELQLEGKKSMSIKDFFLGLNQTLKFTHS